MTPDLIRNLVLGFFAVLVIVAAVKDLSSYTIPNWISAALAGQSAEDLDSNVLRSRQDATFDHKPHGQFTNAIVIALRGMADSDRMTTRLRRYRNIGLR